MGGDFAEFDTICTRTDHSNFGWVGLEEADNLGEEAVEALAGNNEMGMVEPNRDLYEIDKID